MTVSCAKCGEEILGAVNRCWRCGSTFEIHADSMGMPPIRRQPVAMPLDGTVGSPCQNEVAPCHHEGNAAPCGNVDEVGVGAKSAATLLDRPDAVTRRGSPFASGAALVPDLVFSRTDTPQYARRRSDPTRFLAAMIALCVGLLSLFLIGNVPIAAVFIATFGIGMAVWGLYGERRWISVLAILFCLATIGWGGYRSAIQLYIQLHGVDPWQSEEEYRTEEPGPEGES